MLKIINLNLILFSLAIAYGILKIINSYNDKKMEYSVGSEESLPEQISLADIVDKLAEWRPFDELNTEKVKTEYENDFLKNSFRYRFDRCVYRETEDETCKNGAVDLGIDNICCDLIAWDSKYINHVPNSNITIDDKTYKHDFIDCVGGKYNSNGYYHINKFKIDCEKVVCTVKRFFHNGMDYWFLTADTDFSCKLNVSRIDNVPGSTYTGSYDFHIPPIDDWSDFDLGDFHIPPVDLGGSISFHDEWNDEELKDYLRRAKRTPDVISEKFETKKLDFGDEDL